MIFYFSATGNCKYVAERIATVTNDKLVSIAESAKKSEYDFTTQINENIGFVTPTTKNNLIDKQYHFKNF